MAYPVAAGSVSYSGTFIPEIWSAKLTEKFYDATVLAAISNTDYQGEISGQGDKVKIRTIPSLQINDYESGQTLTLQRPQSSNIELLIDKGKYFAAVVDDVQEVQSDIGLMDMWSSDASEQMKIAIDTDVLGTIYASAKATNTGASAGRISGNVNLGTTSAPVGLTKANIVDYLVDIGQVMDEENLPETGRWIILPAWACGLIKKSDLKDASLTGDGQSILRNGRIGMVDRLTIYHSNLLNRSTATNTPTNIIAGHKLGLTFASQMTKMEQLRAESTFGTIMRGVQVYGYKVTNPEAILNPVAYKA